MNPIESQLRFNAALGPHPVSDELPTPADDLTMVTLLLTGHPNPLQQPLGLKVRQLAAVTSVGLEPVAIFLGDQTRRGDQTGNVLLNQAVMKPEPQISGFIDRLQFIASIASQRALQSFPGSWDAGTEQLHVKSPNGYMPPVLMQVDADK